MKKHYRAPALRRLSIGILAARRIQTGFVEPLGRGLLGVMACTALSAISFGASAATITSSSGFVNSSIATQTGTFTASFDASPSISPSNDIMSFSNGAQSAFTGMAASVRFNTTGTIDARNGGAYAAASNIPFTKGTTYHFRLVINVANHTYSAYVTPAGGSELTVASNYAFRTEQASIKSINNFDADVDPKPGGSLTYTTPTISGGSSSSSSSSSSVSSSSSSSKSSSSSSKSSSSSSSVSSSSSSSKSSSSSSSVSSSSSSSSVSSSSSSSTSSLGTVRYRQVFDTLPTGVIWNKSLDSAKIKAHPENALVTAGCGTGGSNCLRVVYRQSDGIHKMPPSSPVFTTTSGVISWTASDASHTNTATDVTQQNLPIDGKTDGTSTKTGTAIPSKAYTLTYDVYFEPGFDFAKGGKLPGLAAAAFDSGCTEDGNVKRSNSNWSERIMWRANGRVEMYSYDQSRPSGSCGVDKMIDAAPGDPVYEVPGQIPNDNKFRFQPGVWYTIRLSVKVNDNNAVTYQRDASGNVMKDPFGDPLVTGGNGEVSLAIKSADGSVKRLLVFPNMAVRDECNGSCPATVPDSKATWINGLFFSTFFGGNETKRTTCLNTAPPSYPGLTQAIYDNLCTSQRIAYIFPTLTWNPQRPSAARFDNLTVTDGYTNAPF